MILYKNGNTFFWLNLLFTFYQVFTYNTFNLSNLLIKMSTQGAILNRVKKQRNI